MERHLKSQSRIQYPVKMPSGNEGKIKIISEKEI